MKGSEAVVEFEKEGGTMLKPRAFIKVPELTIIIIRIAVTDKLV